MSSFGFWLFFFFLVGILLDVLVTIDLGRFDDVDLHSAQSGQNGVELVRIRDPFRQRLVQIIEGEITLFLWRA